MTQPHRGSSSSTPVRDRRCADICRGDRRRPRRPRHPRLSSLGMGRRPADVLERAPIGGRSSRQKWSHFPALAASRRAARATAPQMAFADPDRIVPYFAEPLRLAPWRPHPRTRSEPTGGTATFRSCRNWLSAHGTRPSRSRPARLAAAIMASRVVESVRMLSPVRALRNTITTTSDQGLKPRCGDSPTRR